MLVAISFNEDVNNVCITNDYFEGLVCCVKHKKTWSVVFQPQSHQVLPDHLPRIHFLVNPSVSCKE